MEDVTVPERRLTPYEATRDDVGVQDVRGPVGSNGILERPVSSERARDARIGLS